MKQILVPTDFSECADQAASVARYLARESGAAVCYLHAMTMPTNWGNLPEGWENDYPGVKDRIQEARDELEMRVAKAREAGIGARQELVYLEGNQWLTDVLREREYDLVVMGSQGRSGFVRLMVGSNAERVMRTAHIPVLVVREAPERPVFNTIVFASGMEEDTHAAFSRLIRFAEEVGAGNLHFVEVTTPYNFRPSSIVEEEMRAYIARHEFSALSIHNYVHYTIEAGILAFARSVEADLIAVANHGRTGLSGIFVESIPENLVRHGDLPVLSIRV